MANPLKNNYGRKSLINEEARRNVVNKCWEILEKALDDPDVSDSKKLAIALEVAKKTIPNTIDLGEETIGALAHLANRYGNTGADTSNNQTLENTSA